MLVLAGRADHPPKTAGFQMRDQTKTQKKASIFNNLRLRKEENHIPAILFWHHWSKNLIWPSFFHQLLALQNMTLWLCCFSFFIFLKCTACIVYKLLGVCVFLCVKEAANRGLHYLFSGDSRNHTGSFGWWWGVGAVIDHVTLLHRSEIKASHLQKQSILFPTVSKVERWR